MSLRSNASQTLRSTSIDVAIDSQELSSGGLWLQAAFRVEGWWHTKVISILEGYGDKLFGNKLHPHDPVNDKLAEPTLGYLYLTLSRKKKNGTLKWGQKNNHVQNKSGHLGSCLTN